MGKVISIANQKGGVGKTTTCINLSACLAQAGKKVLTIDLDSQGNTTTGLGLDKNSMNLTIYDVILENCSADKAIQSTAIENLYVLPANRRLSDAEIDLIGTDDSQFILKSIIDADLKNIYDYIIIDCPPSLTIFTVNALTASESVLVPIQCEYYALEGLAQLTYTIKKIKNSLNRNLYIEGIVFTMYDARTNLSLQVVEEVKTSLKSTLNDNVYKVIVPRNVRLAEAPSHGKPITVYDPHSKGAEAYKTLAEAVMNGGEIDG